ncbi:10560_t:CDS:2 [Paraglomus occultum]|uniref:10560_t:CDS:1 n=1 Tax=Paraglomus occultum TaxID=144539 RepID=A0A9N9G4K2_9GLOM|nr:10560_t:CDS:2 [Paraglomus occultum]
MLEEAKPSLKGFFDKLIAGTNPQTKSYMTNDKNKKKFCYFLAGLNNKFINRVKAEIGLLLDASGASSAAIETMAGAGLTVRRMTIARQKAQTETFTDLTSASETHDERVERLLIHTTMTGSNCPKHAEYEVGGSERRTASFH